MIVTLAQFATQKSTGSKKKKKIAKKVEMATTGVARGTIKRRMRESQRQEEIRMMSK